MLRRASLQTSPPVAATGGEVGIGVPIWARRTRPKAPRNSCRTSWTKLAARTGPGMNSLRRGYNWPMGMAEVQDMISLLFSRSLPKHVLAMQVPKRSLGNMNEHWPPKKPGWQLVSCSMFYQKVCVRVEYFSKYSSFFQNVDVNIS